MCPTYFGVCSDVAAVARVAHEHDVPLIVDEAHGAHLAFHAAFPAPALPQGADISIQSTHKARAAALFTLHNTIPLRWAERHARLRQGQAIVGSPFSMLLRWAGWHARLCQGWPDVEVCMLLHVRTLLETLWFFGHRLLAAMRHGQHSWLNYGFNRHIRHAG